MEKAQPHGFVTKAIHWVTGGLLIYGFTKGLDSVDQLADSNLFWFEVYFAMFMGAAFLLRLVWMRASGTVSRLPSTAPKWEHTASKLVHTGMYAGVFGIVLTGLAIAFAYATPLLSGWVLTGLIGLHELSITATYAMLVAHIAGAMWHKVIRRDGVMESMTGQWPTIGRA